jgi:hypothetical protein
MRAQGKSQAEILRMKEGLTDMNEAYRNALGKLLTQKSGLSKSIQDAIAKFADPGLRAEAGSDPVLAELAYRAPEQLADLWGMYTRKPRNYEFRTYVKYLMRSTKGMSGEYGATFGLGKNVVFFKVPDHQPNTPGTDMVGVDLDTGRVWLIDNKAFEATEVSGVSALTRNLPQNILKDLAKFRSEIHGPDVPPEILDALDRLEKAAVEIDTLTNPPGKPMTKEQIARKSTQKAMDGILQKYRIDRVVTNAGGNVGMMSTRLQEIGFILKDMNAPVAPPKVEP